jgi:V8-like Glu-specific endopeptidase
MSGSSRRGPSSGRLPDPNPNCFVPMHRDLVPVVAALTALVWAAGPLEAQSPATPPHAWVSSNLDSGYLHNRSSNPVVVFSQTLSFHQTTWLQLDFADSVSLPAGSFLRLTALQNQAEQRLNARSLNDWQGYSARFVGNDLRLELVAGPHTQGNRVAIDRIARGLIITPPESICGNQDTRVASNDPRQGRLGIGCTGWMIHPDIMLTAGHCVPSGSPNFIEFNVPLSTSSGQTVPSHPDDQYPFNVISSLDQGIGADWAVCQVGPNANHGLLPTDRNNMQWYEIGNVPTVAGSNVIRITGYGSVTPPVSPTLNLAQKTGIGPLSGITGDSLCYATDSSGGNSGGPVIHEQTGKAVGIHTHGGCTGPTACNSGTRIDRPDLWTVIQNQTYTPGSFRTYGQGCIGSGQTFNVCEGLNTSGGPSTQQVTTLEHAYEFNPTST